MKILIINYEYPPLGGGGGKQSMYLAELYAQSNEVYFLTAGWNEFGVMKKDGYILHRLKTKRKKIYCCSNKEMFDFVKKAWLAIPSVLKIFKPDIIQIFFTIPTGMIAFHPKLRKIPYSVSIRGSDVPFHNPDLSKLIYFLFLPFVRKIWSKAHSLISNSETLKSEVLAISPSLNIDVIPNGIDISKFKPKKFNTDSKEITLLFVGRLIPLKQIDFIIRALPDVNRLSESNIYLTIVGNGCEGKYLRSLVSQLNLSKHVTFTDEVDFSKIQEEYANADIYIQLSKVEGMSNTVMEAMASGLPVITTNVGRNCELINGNGILINEVSHNSIVQAILKYSNNKEKIISDGIISRKIIEKYSWDNIFGQNLKILSNVRDSRVQLD
ncbi:MAG: glycosyltransferase family 4 protein [Bacteroidetes bacterium]|nr:glycosyltransferase family 4 protein [Bacteroidota bacterium]